jgi:hypothetical protein
MRTFPRPALGCVGAQSGAPVQFARHDALLRLQTASVVFRAKRGRHALPGGALVRRVRSKKKCMKKLYPVPPLRVYYRITLAPCRLAGTLAGSPSPLCRHWNLHTWPYSPLVLFPDDTFLGEADVPDDLH